MYNTPHPYQRSVRTEDYLLCIYSLFFKEESIGIYIEFYRLFTIYILINRFPFVPILLFVLFLHYVTILQPYSIYFSKKDYVWYPIVREPYEHQQICLLRFPRMTHFLTYKYARLSIMCVG